jgi:heptosyltransferase II
MSRGGGAGSGERVDRNSGAVPVVRVGAPAAPPESATPPGSTAPHATSLVIQTSYLGDTVLTTPLIAELATRGPVDVVVTPAAAELLSNNPFIRTLFVYDKRRTYAGAGGVLRMARDIRRNYLQFAVKDSNAGGTRTAYMAQGSLRSAALALLAGCHERVGFATSAGRALYTVSWRPRAGMHHVERLWRLAFAAPESRGGVAAPVGAAPLPRLYPGRAEREAVDAILGGTRDQRPIVALAPGSAWATKRWPYYAELARRLAPSFRLAIVGSSADSAAARSITETAGAQGVVDATGKLSLLGSAELIGRVALLVTNDSSPQHLASAMGTPTVTIFGPTVPELGFGPLAPYSVAVGHKTLDCRPCHQHGLQKCPLGHLKCMKELDVTNVEAAVWKVLQSAELRDSGGRVQGSGTAPA